jgi:ribosomal protein L19E
MINRLIAEIVEADMAQVKKMKKSEIINLAELLMRDNLRELTDDSIIRIYEEQFNTNLSGV